MDPEERKKKEAMKKEREKYLASRNAELAERQRIQEASMVNRKAKAEQKITEGSVANKLNFGMTLATMNPD